MGIHSFVIQIFLQPDCKQTKIILVICGPFYNARNKKLISVFKYFTDVLKQTYIDEFWVVYHLKNQKSDLFFLFRICKVIFEKLCQVNEALLNLAWSSLKWALSFGFNLKRRGLVLEVELEIFARWARSKILNILCTEFTKSKKGLLDISLIFFINFSK